MRKQRVMIGDDMAIANGFNICRVKSTSDPLVEHLYIHTKLVSSALGNFKDNLLAIAFLRKFTSSTALHGAPRQTPQGSRITEPSARPVLNEASVPPTSSR